VLNTPVLSDLSRRFDDFEPRASWSPREVARVSEPAKDAALHRLFKDVNAFGFEIVRSRSRVRPTNDWIRLKRPVVCYSR
jgi:hypothetical protein